MILLATMAKPKYDTELNLKTQKPRGYIDWQTCF